MANDVVEAKIVSMLDALQTGVVTVAGEAVKYAPDVMQAALTVTRINGIQSLVIGLGTLIGSYALIRIIHWAIKREDDENDGLIIPVGIFGGIGLIIAVITIFCCLLDVWVYVAIFEPKLFIAHQIVQQVLK